MRVRPKTSSSLYRATSFRLSLSTEIPFLSRNLWRCSNWHSGTNFGHRGDEELRPWVLGTPMDDDRKNGMGIVVEYANKTGLPRWVKPQKKPWNYALFGQKGTL